MGRTAGSLWLSRFELNPRNKKAQQDLRDCQKMFETLLAGFGGGSRQKHNLLHRVEARGDGRAFVLVQSTTEPNWDHLRGLGDGGYLRSNGQPNPAVKDVSFVLEKVRDGMDLAFLLKANATRREWKTGKRCPHRAWRNQMEWLARKAKECGFKPLVVHATQDVFDVDARPAGKVEGYREVTPDEKKKGAEKDRHRLTFEGVTYHGRLQVTDAAHFRKALMTGVGPGKAYGFGLLSVRPLGSA
ncbi:MAG: type I-E CRISPR-associated protein Cas6/Cse3/CasE [Promethearchaeota archaeon]